MSVTNLTPDSTVLQQVDGQWQKLAMLLLWKLAGREKVKLTHQEIAACGEAFAPGVPVLFTHGHSDSIEFQVIDMASADRLAAHDATMRGSA